MRRLDIGVLDRDATHLQFYYYCFFPWGLGAPILTPGEGGFDHPALRNVARIVATAKRQVPPRTSEPITKYRVGPTEPPLQRLGVGVDQQLVRIEPMPVRRIEGPVNTISVKQVRASVRQIGVPDLVGIFRKHDARLFLEAGAIEQAKLDPFGMRRKNRKVHTLAVPSGPERVRATRPDLPRRSHQ